MNHNYCVIMAGGIGSRFWPLSRTEHPKQFIDILGTGRSLIQQTFDRFKNIVAPENFLVVTNEIYKVLVEFDYLCYAKRSIINKMLFLKILILSITALSQPNI